jgi:imidazolonepropionase-like amidohydrolase
MDDELGRYPKMPYSIAQAIIDEAHKGHTRVVAHVFYLQDAKQLASYGVNGFMHSVRDQPVDLALIQTMKQHDTWQVASTLSREASMFIYGAPAPFLNDPFFTRAIAPPVVEKLASPTYQQTIRSNPDFAKYPQFLSTAEHNLKTLVDAGIPYGCGTDSGPPRRFPGYFVHWEMELMVQAGLTPMQALTACTRNAADFLHAGSLGTIEMGKWADFIVLEKNPLDDIKNTRTIDAVYIAGNLLH